MKHFIRNMAIIAAFATLSAQSITAQNVKVFLKDGTTAQYMAAEVDSVVFDADNTFHPRAVDLGLSVKWATCNIGAEEPNGIGDFFAWGETKTKERYSRSTYFDPDYEYTTNNNDTCIAGKPEYDAATAAWGREWRMPTEKEFQELLDKCRWKSIRMNGVNGYRVTGPNGNNIFLPANGGMIDDEINSSGQTGLYWTACTSSEYSEAAHNLSFSTSLKYVYVNYRYIGMGIRPVLVEKKNETD